MTYSEKLKKYIKIQSEYNKAGNLYESGYATIVKTNSFWKNDIIVDGEVYDEDKLYNCSITLSNSEIVSFRCTCSMFLKEKQFCAHTGALFLCHFKNILNKEKLVYTSTETRKTVNAYLNRNIKKYSEKSVTDIAIDYEARVVKQYLEVSFYLVTNDKRYKIKNLFEFFRMMENSDCYEYGRNFFVVHKKENFSEVSRKQLEFILMNVRNERFLCGISGQSETLIKNKSSIIIAGENLDRFISILYEQGKSLKINGKKYSIIYENPEIVMKISEVGTSGYNLSILNITAYLNGNGSLYLFGDTAIFKADDRFISDTGVFIENIFSDINHRLSINKNDMSSFCNGVLPSLLEYCSVDMPQNMMKLYEPWDLKCKFILRRNDTAVCMRVDAKYNDDFFDLQKGICSNKNVCRDYNAEYLIKNILEKYHFMNTATGELKLIEYEDIYEFLKNGVKELKTVGEVTVSEELKELKLVENMKIGAKVSVNDNWLNLEIDAGDYSQKELETLIYSYREKKKYIKLNKNTIVKLEDNDLELLAGMAYDLDFTASDLVNDNIFVPKYRALYIDSRLSGQVSVYSKDDGFKSLVRTIKQIENSEVHVPEKFTQILRDYQKTGFRWLKTMDFCGFGGILADDMGLGKTIQILALLYDEYVVNKCDKKTLIVVPTSLIYNWENEITRFAGELKITAVTGAKSERIQILETSVTDIFITSYELLKRDVEEYSKMNFRFQILDEAQNIKNYTTINARAVKKIKAETKFALTGTPIENYLSELWSIFDFVMPGFLYTNKKFKDKFEIPIVKDGQREAINGLTRMISPFILRREKRQVLKELPEKLEYNLYAKMEGEQHKLYTANVIKLKEEITNKNLGEYASNKIKFLAELTKLRQICCDPSLCYEDYEDESAKLELCVDLVKDSIAGGHKILIFSQFTSMLQIISKRFMEEKISFYTMTGATGKEERMTLVNKFNKDKTSVFLISLRVGGTGLNLTSADIVIHYDPWWNVAVQNQATDRAHRIGQDKVVSVFKLIAKNSVEENIIKLQRSKEELSSDIINGENISLSGLSKEELLSILNG